jgi:predicted DsbA family dithiol-disulfide isomerase
VGDHGDALFRACLTEGGDLNDRKQLVDLASGVTLDVGEVRGAWRMGTVRTKYWRVRRRGAARYSGVPFYVFDGRWSLAGAQPVEVFGHAIDAGRGERVT